MKLYTKVGKWVVEDKGRKIFFDKSTDAWMYVFLMREIREKPPVAPPSLYPVRSLNPIPARRCKTVVLQNG